jgi:hypothetical protein
MSANLLLDFRKMKYQTAWRKVNNFLPFLEVVKNVTLPAGVALDHGVGGEELQGHGHSTQGHHGRKSQQPQTRSLQN